MRTDSRSRLREFQTRLTERLAQAMASPVTNSRLGILINDSRWLVDLDEAGEIFPLQDIATVPHTHDWYRGLTNVRGSLVSVVDLSLFLGGSPTRTDRDSRVLSFASSLDFNVGIIVTRTLGLHNPAQWRSVGSQLVDENEQSWTPISFSALTVDERFLEISPLGSLPVQALG
ncbi:MAG: chemotaxis protein CheW [Burkholderiales bacterium]